MWLLSITQLMTLGLLLGANQVLGAAVSGVAAIGTTLSMGNALPFGPTIAPTWSNPTYVDQDSVALPMSIKTPKDTAPAGIKYDLSVGVQFGDTTRVVSNAPSLASAIEAAPLLEISKRSISTKRNIAKDAAIAQRNGYLKDILGFLFANPRKARISAASRPLFLMGSLAGTDHFEQLHLIWGISQIPPTTTQYTPGALFSGISQCINARSDMRHVFSEVEKSISKFVFIKEQLIYYIKRSNDPDAQIATERPNLVLMRLLDEYAILISHGFQQTYESIWSVSCLESCHNAQPSRHSPVVWLDTAFQDFIQKYMSITVIDWSFWKQLRNDILANGKLLRAALNSINNTISFVQTLSARADVLDNTAATETRSRLIYISDKYNAKLLFLRGVLEYFLNVDSNSPYDPSEVKMLITIFRNVLSKKDSKVTDELDEIIHIAYLHHQNQLALLTQKLFNQPNQTSEYREWCTPVINDISHQLKSLHKIRRHIKKTYQKLHHKVIKQIKTEILKLDFSSLKLLHARITRPAPTPSN
ncbi:hypothetical protein NEHOM01_0155 [Nematocida homosporus]|uniref:uncharacterized protein n=1 Tax=Nematocida homosporus TaxID=1912981 RepID=UPI00221FF5BC|nr:uncharacterized protein NEHOM01_0155 [Nematocida homosporus]KAI5184410.1 hypothetical protein NEHOM01_0155 [Nematocida homosporus]